MVDFIELESIETLKVTFLDPTTGLPIDVTSPTIEIGFYEGASFLRSLPESPLIKVAGKIGEYIKQIYLDTNIYFPNQFYYVRYRGLHPITGNLILAEDTFRTLPSSQDENTQVQFLENNPPRCVVPAPEFYISANSEAGPRRAFVVGELLGPNDLWIEIIDAITGFPKNAYFVSYDIEDLTDCRGVCESECGGILIVDSMPAVNCDTGRYYADWHVIADGNPGPYKIHWDIIYTPTSQSTRVSYGFHVVKKKNAYDLNFQEPFSPWSPTADN